MNEYKIAREEVARVVGIEVKELTYILYKEKIDKLYVEFEIPKKNGKTRLIHSPKKNLKWIQRQLSKSLFKRHLEYLEKNDIQSIVSHGFQKGKSIITNAKIHKNKKYLLNVDISDFFSSFHFGRVRGYLEKSREFEFSKEVSTIISQLVCYKGVLPQGAPTSPIITNIIFNIVDLRILALAKKYKLDYTRYADDMSFSTNNSKFIYEYKVFIDELTTVLKKSGFNINSDKTRLEYSSSRQEVTGLTVNKKVNASRLFIKDTRAMANQLYTKGEFLINGENGTLNQLEGRFSFINQLDWHNNKIEYIIKKLKSNKKYISGLNAREKQYQKFLFYKYFFMPQKPTIVTEGKTDIVHIKSALKKHYEKYPKMIVREKDGFEFQVNFLNKTKKLSYFLGIVENGADTMKNIWNFYTGSNNCLNIYSFLFEKNETKNLQKNNPVILLFDNEQKNQKSKDKKPLKEFLDYTKIKLENECRKELIGNLYLQTIHLVNDLEECEIEDLYPKDILDIEIGDKTFSRDSRADTKQYFGKHKFSLYISKHYQEIDFENFFPLLDSINEILP